MFNATMDGPVSLFPPNGEVGELEELAEIVEAVEECQLQQDGSDVCIVEDGGLGGQAVLELRGPSASVVFRSASVEPYLILYVKSMDSFFSFSIEVVDGDEKYYTLHYSNRRTIIKVHATRCDLPIFIKSRSWQYLKIDIRETLRKAFDTDYFSTVQVSLTSNCRLFKLYFSALDYADLQLPPHLQLLRAY